MKSLSGLYFHLEIKDNDQVLSLVRQSLEHIEQLETAGIHIKYMQLRANELPSLCSNKEIWIKIDSDKGTYIASNASVEWTQAFTNTLKAVEEKVLYKEADYVKPGGLFEIDLYSSQGNSLTL
jgi:hypothetical protein